MESASRPFVLDPTGRDIHADNAELRARGAATLVELPGQVVAWSITDPELLKRLLSDPKVSKNPRQHWAAWRDGEVPADWPLMIWVAVQNMFTAYGGEHRRLRSLVSKAFTFRRTEALRPWVEEITSGLLDQLDGTEGAVDLRESFAYPLPIEVICQLFGVPDEHRADLRKAVDGVFNTTATPEEAAANGEQMYRILGELVATRRAEPGDDLASGLIAARDEDGSSLQEAELIDTLILMISAGHETTVNLIDHAITALLTHPTQLRQVLDGEFGWGDVIEETLRWQAPVAHLPLRYAVDDIVVNDEVTIKRGEAILASYAAVGRAPQVGNHPEKFDLSRPNKNHLSFGHGVHFCLGAPLARLEAEIALPALFTRFPDLALAVDPAELETTSSFISNGHRVLPVTLG